ASVHLPQYAEPPPPPPPKRRQSSLPPPIREPPPPPPPNRRPSSSNTRRTSSSPNRRPSSSNTRRTSSSPNRRPSSSNTRRTSSSPNRRPSSSNTRRTSSSSPNKRQASSSPYAFQDSSSNSFQDSNSGGSQGSNTQQSQSASGSSSSASSSSSSASSSSSPSTSVLQVISSSSDGPPSNFTTTSVGSSVFLSYPRHFSHPLSPFSSTFNDLSSSSSVNLSPSSSSSGGPFPSSFPVSVTESSNNTNASPSTILSNASSFFSGLFSSPSSSSSSSLVDLFLDPVNLEKIKDAGLTAENEEEFLDHFLTVLTGEETRQGTALTLDPVTIISLLTLAAYMVRAVYQIMSVSNKSSSDTSRMLPFQLEERSIHHPLSTILTIPGNLAAIIKLQREGHQPCVRQFVCEQIKERAYPEVTVSDIFIAGLGYYFGEADLGTFIDGAVSGRYTCDFLPEGCSQRTLRDAHYLENLYSRASFKFFNLLSVFGNYLLPRV
ncbi:hypothetical protein Hamer_G021793, partial [Homarus americanus]